MRIFVGNVTFSTSEFDLEELFGRYGRVTRTTIATDRVTGRSRGFGFGRDARRHRSPGGHHGTPRHSLGGTASDRQ
jgi:hypothetical protein